MTWPHVLIFEKERPSWREYHRKIRIFPSQFLTDSPSPFFSSFLYGEAITISAAKRISHFHLSSPVNPCKLSCILIRIGVLLLHTLQTLRLPSMPTSCYLMNADVSYLVVYAIFSKSASYLVYRILSLITRSRMIVS